MALIRCSTSSGGGGNATLKDVYRDIVLNSSLTQNSLTVYSGRCTLSEGAWVDDTANKTIYVYADFTINGAQSSGTNQLIMTLANMTSNKRPYVYAADSATRGQATLTTDNSSSNTNGFVAYLFSTPSAVGITLPNGLGAADGDHYIVYGSWNY